MDNDKKGLYIQLYSLHGLIKRHDLELGRDADTGGQTKYVLELANKLSESPEIRKIELVTRLIRDKNISSDYSIPIEKVNDKFDIIRITSGGGKYIRKELLWNHLEEFIDKTIKYLKAKKQLPDLIHSHYADAGYVCSELSDFFEIPFIHTSHSLGKDKLQKLLENGLLMENIDKRYKMSRRTDAEEKIFHSVNFIITSTNQEIENHKKSYKNSLQTKFVVIPPGFNLDKFYSYSNHERTLPANDETVEQIKKELNKFFMNMEKPLILTLCRPDKRKNITGLITAYGENNELQGKANLAIYAGIREDIQTMEENEKEVLTDILLLMDKYNLYGKMAIPKKHDTEMEVPALYRYAASTGGVFVNAALSETFGLTLIEAAASGLPVVATNAGGPHDIIANCNNGILVDVSKEKNISSAIIKLLDDKTLWEKSSQNGIINSREIYSWNTHVKKYINEIKSLPIMEKPAEEKVNETGRKLFKAKGLVVADIDNTLLGNDESLYRLSKLLNELSPDISFTIATGRVIESAMNKLSQYDIQLPDVLITSVGSEIFYNLNDKIIYSKGWEAHISKDWKRDKIVELLSRFSFLKYQEDSAQRKFKISYYLQDNPMYLKQVKSLLITNRIKCNVIYSHGEFLDILPYRASKGKAIRYLGYRYNIPFDKILTAGDSGNDIEMLKGDLLGVVVGNYSSELEKLRGSRNIYFSQYNYAAGIIDGIKHYDLVNICKENNEYQNHH